MRANIVISLILAAALIACASSPSTPDIVSVPSIAQKAQPSTTSTPSSTPVPPSSAPPLPATALSKPAVISRIPLYSLPGVGRAPVAIALLGNVIYTANRESDNVAVIRDRRVQSFISTASGPNALIADPNRSVVYVATYYTPTLSVISNDRIVKTISLDEAAESLALAGDRLLVGLGSTATIQVRDPVTLELKGSVRLNEGSDVLLMLVDPGRQRLYASGYGWVTVLDLKTLQEIDSFQAPYLFGSLALGKAEGSLWAGVYDDKASRGYLVEYDESGKVLQRVELGPDLRAAVVDSGNRIFVTDSFLNQVAIVDGSSGRIVSRINVGVHPTSLLLDEPNHVVYVTGELSDNLYVLDITDLQVVAVLPVGMDVSALVENNDRQRIYAASASTDSVFVLERGKVIKEIAVGHHPVDLALDPGTNRLFVANSADGALTIVDEESLAVQATVAITRSLATVAVDSVNRRLFAGSVVLGLDKLEPESVILAMGPGLFSPNLAEFVRVNPINAKLYILASNGIPGSNSRTILYSFLESNLSQSKVVGYPNGGNVTSLALDPGNNRVYGTVTHPLAYTNALEVWNADDTNVVELPLASRTSGLVINDRTNHLFLAHATSYGPPSGTLGDRENGIQILDFRSLGEVDWIPVPGEPAVMALLGDTVYVAGSSDGIITLIADVPTSLAPAPTATFTPTPYPSSTPTLQSAITIQSTVTRSPITAPCVFPIGTQSEQIWKAGAAQRLGCPVESEKGVQFAVQQFEHGAMYYRDDMKRIYVLFDDGSGKDLQDNWVQGSPQDSCSAITVAKGLIKPIRGFGKVWCDEEGVRSKIGGATSGEIGLYSASVQQFELGLVFGPSNSAQVRVNQIFVLLNDGRWE